MVGTTVSHYHILARLGEGGMGTVYLAEDTRLKRRVALKFPRRPQRSDPEAQRRMLQEARSAAALEHPHICAVHEIGEFDGQSFIVMEYVQGRTLEAVLEDGPLSTREAIRITATVAAALETAHEQGIVHRDLKPSNIMVADSRHVKVMDFGLAARAFAPSTDPEAPTLASAVTAAGLPAGTLAYMSPEQLLGRPVDGRSDIFSLGIVLFEAITGIHPFRRRTPMETAQATLNEVPPPLGRYREEVPELLEHLVRKMLAKDPSNRYHSSRELGADLGGVSAEPVPGQPPVRRRPGWPAARVIVPAALVGLLVLLIWLAGEFFPRRGVEASPKSVAVLPFVNLSPDRASDYFAYGMTEDTITHLSKVRDLKVMSLAAVAPYQGNEPDLREIGKDLRVATLLVGNVRRDERQVRIGVRLLDAGTLEQLWASSYDRETEGIFQIQSEVAHRIAMALEAELTAEEEVRIGKPPTGDIGAYDLYLKGREYYNRYRFRDNENAIALFERSLELDPDFAAASAALADGYVRRYYQFGGPVRWVHEAIEISRTALSRDPECAEAHKSLGFAYAVLGWQEEALRSYSRAVELSPHYHPAIANVAVILEAKGRFDEALAWSRRALELNPTAPITHFNMGDVYLDLHDLEEAERWYRRALELQPDYLPAFTSLIALLITREEYAAARRQLEELSVVAPESESTLVAAADLELFSGRRESARESYRKALERTRGRNRTASLRLAHLLREDGGPEEAHRLLDRIVEDSRDRIDEGSESWHPRWFIAMSHAVRGETEAALVWLQSAADSGWRPKLLDWRAPEYASIREEARFQALMRRLQSQIEEQRRRVAAGGESP